MVERLRLNATKIRKNAGSATASRLKERGSNPVDRAIPKDAEGRSKF
jgi:hypothetical protein